MKAELTRLREELKEGEPCPLCGSHEHPHIMDPAHVEQDRKAIDQELQKLEEQEAKLRKAFDRLTEKKGAETNRKQQEKELQEKLEGIGKEREAHRKACPWSEEGKVPDDIRERLEKAEKEEEGIRKEEGGLVEKRDKVEQCRKTHERYKEEEQNIRQQIADRQSRIDTLKEGFQTLDPEELLKIDPEKLRKEGKEQQEKARKLQEQYEEKGKHLNRLRERNSGLKERIAGNEKEKKRARKEQQEQQKALEQALVESEFSDREQVREVLDEELDLEKTRQQVESFEREKFLLEKRVAELQQVLGEEGFDGEKYEKQQEQAGILEKKLKEERDKRARWKTELERQEKELAQKKQWEAELKTLNKREENLATLRRLFKGSGFVNFVSGVYLQDLVRAANARFHKLTDQQLWLETTEDNEIQVRDLVHDGQVRHIKTLSGGQTFQASLCLALSLAESVRKRSGSNEQFFFLDEGFGTLDRESLGTVFDTLRSLRKEGRLVGVISHVEDLQESIDVHLRIENDPEKGSQVRASWEGG